MKLFAQLIMAILLVANSHAIPGQPGTLDATWAPSSPIGAGKAITPVGNDLDVASAVALQADGKVVVVGGCAAAALLLDFCVIRYLPNGTLDASFGTGGKVITSVGSVSGNGEALALTLQPDGKIVLAGYCLGSSTTNDFCSARYLADGTLDASFGTGGTVVTPVGNARDLAYSIALQADGKLVLAGFCDGSDDIDFCAIRYLSDGMLDVTFGTGGKVITPVGAGSDRAYALALQPDGKLVLSGQCGNGSDTDFCALRYLSNGTLDASFGSGGTVVTPVGVDDDSARALALQPDGKLVLAGGCSNGSNDDFCALRYLADGTLDASFGTAGKVITPLGSSNDFARAIALQPDGKLVLAGICFGGPSNNDFCALRYQSNGTLDASFGSGGTVITPVGSLSDAAVGLVLQPDGKLVLAGVCRTSINPLNDDFCAVRYDGTAAAIPSSTTAPVPTLGHFAMLLLSLGIAALGMGRFSSRQT